MYFLIRKKKKNINGERLQSKHNAQVWHLKQIFRNCIRACFPRLKVALPLFAAVSLLQRTFRWNYPTGELKMFSEGKLNVKRTRWQWNWSVTRKQGLYRFSFLNLSLSKIIHHHCSGRGQPICSESHGNRRTRWVTWNQESVTQSLSKRWSQSSL